VLSACSSEHSYPRDGVSIVYLAEAAHSTDGMELFAAEVMSAFA
jgi:hypothetical protein